MVKRKTVPKEFQLGNVRLLTTAEWPVVDARGRVTLERPKAIGYTEGLVLVSARGDYIGFIAMGLRRESQTPEYVFYKPGSSSGAVSSSLLSVLDRIFLGEPYGSTLQEYEKLGDFIQRWHAERLG